MYAKSHSQERVEGGWNLHGLFLGLTQHPPPPGPRLPFAGLFSTDLRRGWLDG